jgi:hemolysin III
MLKSIKQDYKAHNAEEKANIITHAAAFLALIIATPFLFYETDSFNNYIGFSAFIYGLGFMYLSSSIYHLHHLPDAKFKWQIIDHISIFVLISCSYTAFILKFYPSAEGYKFLFFHWLLCFTGIGLKLWLKNRYEYVFLLIYIIQGWLVVFIYDQVTYTMTYNMWLGLILGGIFYMVGVFFYIWDSLKFNHAIWHVFVFLGSSCHFLSLYL